MLNKGQIKLIQIAVKQAGIRAPKSDGRYRLLLGQYKQSGGSPVTSCKQLNNWQLEDLLAICEAQGFRSPGKPDDYFRKKVRNSHTAGDIASYAQQEAVKKLAGDLGWNEYQLGGLIKRLTGGKSTSVCELTHGQAYGTIEALKSIVGREMGKKYTNLDQVKEDFTETTDGKEKTRQVG